MTLDMGGCPVLPWYFKYVVLSGVILGIRMAYLEAINIMSSPLWPPQQLFYKSTPIDEIIPIIIEEIPIVIGALFLSFIIFRIWDYINKVGLPREDEVH